MPAAARGPAQVWREKCRNYAFTFFTRLLPSCEGCYNSQEQEKQATGQASKPRWFLSLNTHASPPPSKLGTHNPISPISLITHVSRRGQCRGSRRCFFSALLVAAVRARGLDRACVRPSRRPLRCCCCSSRARRPTALCCSVVAERVDVEHKHHGCWKRCWCLSIMNSSITVHAGSGHAAAHAVAQTHLIRRLERPRSALLASTRQRCRLAPASLWGLRVSEVLPQPCNMLTSP